MSSSYDELVARSRRRRRESLRPGTRDNIAHHWTAFRAFLAPLKSTPRTASPLQLLAFLESRLERGITSATALNYLSSIRSEIRRRDWPVAYPFHPEIKEWVIGLGKWNDDEFKLQPYISRDQLDEVLDAAGRSAHKTLFTAMLTFGFYSMMRISNLVVSDPHTVDQAKSLTKGDLTLLRDQLRINLRWSKTLQKKSQAKFLAVPIIGNSTCPHAAMEAYLASTGDQPPDSPLFTWPDGTPICQKEYRDILTSLHDRTTIDEKAKAHAYRRGGAVFYYQAGVELEHIKRLGTWSSDAIYTYIRQAAPDVSGFARLLNPDATPLVQPPPPPNTDPSDAPAPTAQRDAPAPNAQQEQAAEEEDEEAEVSLVRISEGEEEEED